MRFRVVRDNYCFYVLDVKAGIYIGRAYMYRQSALESCRRLNAACKK